SGLEGRGLVLELNGADTLPIASNGAFTFPNALASGSAYEIIVSVQPDAPSQTCTVANASGVVGSGAASSASVTCATDTFAVSGTVVGLEGDRLVLQNSNETVEVESDGTFSFPGRIASGRGTVTTADVTAVSASCTRGEFTIGGVVGPVAGSGLLLRNDPTDDLTVNEDGEFTFATAIESART